MFRLMWSAFVEWYASADDVSLNEEEHVLQCISDGLHCYYSAIHCNRIKVIGTFSTDGFVDGYGNRK